MTNQKRGYLVAYDITVGAERERAGIAFLADRQIGDFGTVLARQPAVLVDGLGDLGVFLWKRCRG